MLNNIWQLQYWKQILTNICCNMILIILIACNWFCCLLHQSYSTFRFCILCFAGIQYKWFQYFAVGNTPNTGSTLSLPWILQQQILASHRSCQYFWIFLNIVASSANTGITSALATIWHHVATLELTIWRFHFDICANPILSSFQIVKWSLHPMQISQRNYCNKPNYCNINYIAHIVHIPIPKVMNFEHF